VLQNFGPEYFKTNGQWQAIFSVLSATNPPAFFTLDNRIPPAVGAFNWPPMWLTQSGGTLSTSALENYLAAFQQNGSSWPAFISSTFPRFHDIYAEAGIGSSYGTLNDNNGDTLRSTLARALTNASAFVQVVTWNDFGEGTIVEPTKQFGYRDLGIIQEFRRQYLAPGFAHQTNDLALATRFYGLRRQHAANPNISAELDRVFTNVISGNLIAAELQLSGLESKQPAIYDLSRTAGVLQFSLGGYVSASGAEVQTNSNLGLPTWTTATYFAANTNLIRFSAPVSAQGPPGFFRVRTTAP
jgi:hypothetical protein